MPFRGLSNGQIVTPAVVPDQEAVTCPECGDMMYPREGEETARHFYHVTSDASENCSVAHGESDTHARCAALAVEALQNKFGDQADRYGAEIVIDVSDTPTTPDTRRADALLEFNSENAYFGQGLITEVQHRNHSKDIEGTTHDYLNAGYSVAWLTTDDFEKEELDYSVVEEQFRLEDGAGYSVRDHDPWEFETRVTANFRWDDPDSGCDHSWRRVPGYAHPDGYEYEFCPFCEGRRQYDNELTRFVYDDEGVLAPEFPKYELEDAVIKGRGWNEKWPDWMEDSPLEVGLTFCASVYPCRGPKRVHEWSDPEEIGGRCIVRECRHCPVRLLENPENEVVLITHPKYDLDGVRRDPSRCSHPCHSNGYSMDSCPDCHVKNP